MIYTSEQVSKYHPDKMADQVADYLLTEILKKDENSHVAIEVTLKKNICILAGEVKTSAKINYNKLLKYILPILYRNKKIKFKIINLIDHQSSEIDNTVEDGGAGDQGIMFGYAENKPEFNYMPADIFLGRKYLEYIENNTDIFLGDAKVQISIDEYNVIHSFLVSAAFNKKYINSLDFVRFKLLEYFNELCKKYNIKKSLDINLSIQPSGVWTLAGPFADTGVVGRKIVCDQYGCHCEVGGGAFSGKDPSKVDRSAAYMARYAAKDVCKNFNVKYCKIRLAYAIGIAEPFDFYIDCGVDENETEKIKKYLLNKFSFKPNYIIKLLDLKKYNYFNDSGINPFVNNKKI